MIVAVAGCVAGARDEARFSTGRVLIWGEMVYNLFLLDRKEERNSTATYRDILTNRKDDDEAAHTLNDSVGDLGSDSPTRLHI